MKTDCAHLNSFACFVICRHFQLEQINKDLFGAVVVAQLAEWSLPTPKVHGLNPDVYFPIVNCIEKTEIKKERPGMAHF